MEKGTRFLWGDDTFRFEKYSIGSIEEAYGGFLFQPSTTSDNFLEIDFDSELPKDVESFVQMLEMTLLLAQKLSMQRETDIVVNFSSTIDEDLQYFEEQLEQYKFEYVERTDTWSKVVTCEVVEQE